MLDQSWNELKPLLAFRTLEFICIMCSRIQVIAQRGEGSEHSLADKTRICSAIEWARWSNVIVDTSGRRSSTGTCPFDSFIDANVGDDIEGLHCMGYLVTSDPMTAWFDMMRHGRRRCEVWRTKWTFRILRIMCGSHPIMLHSVVLATCNIQPK